MSELIFGAASVRPGGSRLPLFFVSPDLERVLAELLGLTEKSRSIPVVKAPKGAGKSTLAYQFLHAAPEHWLLCRIDANPLMHPEQLLNLLGIAFGVREESDQLAEDLLERLFDLRERGNLPVVVIDDAHLLPVATIVALLRLHERSDDPRNGPAIRILLFARNTIDEVLKAPPIQAMNLQVLRPITGLSLDRVQCERFIRHVLGYSGLSARLPLHSAKVDAIFRESFGMPGRIEELTVEAVGAGELFDPRRRHPWARFAAGAALLGGIAVGGWWLVEQGGIGSLSRHEASTPDPAPEAPAVAETTPPPPAAESGSPSQGNETPPAAALAEAPQHFQPPPAQQPASTPAHELAPAIPPVFHPQEPAVKPSEQIPAQPAGMAGMLPSPSQQAPAEQPAPQPQHVEAQPAPPPLADPKSVMWKREDWLMAQNGGNFTIQVAAVGGVEAIRRFAARYPLQGDLAWFQSVRDGRPWYSILFGSYPNRNAAQAALRALPQPLRDGGAWLRPFSAVQEEVRQAKRFR